MIHGIPVPSNLEHSKDKTDPQDGTYGTDRVKGTPVSGGRYKGACRVITKLEDAASIQKGDILITISTDIGWSPYFPLLGGVVTELGGLISHGAVVAREYGLPCIVGAEMGTTLFKSGDIAVIDGFNGTITKESNNQG